MLSDNDEHNDDHGCDRIGPSRCEISNVRSSPCQSKSTGENGFVEVAALAAERFCLFCTLNIEKIKSDNDVVKSNQGKRKLLKHPINKEVSDFQCDVFLIFIFFSFNNRQIFAHPKIAKSKLKYIGIEFK